MADEEQIGGAQLRLPAPASRLSHVSTGKGYPNPERKALRSAWYIL